mgnify:CR=1 FL=1
MRDIDRVIAYLQSEQQAAVDRLCQFLRIPSVSADSKYASDVRRAAEWVGSFLRDAGLKTETIENHGHPLILAETPHQDGLPIVLIYGHYDVQPAENIHLWTSSPFEPTIRNGAIYARGASDDKGQLLTHMLSVQAWKQVTGSWPVNFKFIVEGEEETGSHVLQRFLEQAGDRLACDCVVISDGSQFGPDQPAITYGLRGIAYFELRVSGPSHDLHSGVFGGTVTNPANALAQMLAGLIDDEGRVNIPGFYDDVDPPTPEERERLRQLPFDEKAFWQSLGVDSAVGEVGYTVLERRWIRPTYDVCGIWGGYHGEGAKTVIPAEAGAKISFRLVPRQQPGRVRELLERRLKELCPPGVRFQLIDLHGSPAVVTPLDSPFIKAAEKALRAVFPNPPVFTREGGSIPIVSKFQERLRADVLLLGWGQYDDNAHGPDEKFLLADFHRGTLASAYLWEEIREIANTRK